jgi:hypothetical protein
LVAGAAAVAGVIAVNCIVSTVVVIAVAGPRFRSDMFLCSSQHVSIYRYLSAQHGIDIEIFYVLDCRADQIHKLLPVVMSTW